MYPVRRQTSPHAARLRRDRTDAEAIIWQMLRNRQLEEFKFRFQASIGSFVVDFLCVEAMLVVELDGGQHDDAVDARRTAFLEARGYRVIRFWNTDVMNNRDGVLAAIRSTLIARMTASIRKKTLTQPSPAKAGEGYAATG